MYRKIIIAIILVLILGIVLPRFFLKDKATSLSEGPQCPHNEAAEFLDNPFERIMLVFGGLQTISKEEDGSYPNTFSGAAYGEYNFIVRAYTIFGIPFATVKVEECYGAVQRIVYNNNSRDETQTIPPSDKITTECLQKLADQREYLKNDTLAATETFEKYPTNNILQTTPADLDINSNKTAKNFRTVIREELASGGVNFAGSYSIVAIGMTGIGVNYFIVDRKTGHAYPFPYYVGSTLEFKKDSNLIIMNPKSAILDLTTGEGAQDPSGCYLLNQEHTIDLRSFYFLWKDNQLVLIGPKDITPPLSTFWAGSYRAQDIPKF